MIERELYELKGQGVQDNRSYDVVEDVVRVEQYLFSPTTEPIGVPRVRAVIATPA